jgi:hypothetical protein
MANNCDTFHLVKDGDYCFAISKKNSISLPQFYAWNPDVGTSWDGLWLDVYFCVSIIGRDHITTSVPPSTTVNSTPVNDIQTSLPIHTDMVKNCNLFHLVKDGDLCVNIVPCYGISLSQFYKWIQL